MKIIKHTAYILLMIGGLNWGIYGLSGHDIIEILFGFVPMIARIIYVLIGLASAYIIAHQFSQCSCTGCVCDTSNTCKCTESSATYPKKTEEFNSQA